MNASSSLHWIPRVYAVELKKLLTYRVDFWLQALAVIAVQLCAAYFLWDYIYTSQHAKQIGGFTKHGMIFYYLASVFMYQIANPSIGSVATEVYDGSLTRYLIYPISFFMYKYLARVANSTLILFQFILTLGIFWIAFDVPVEMQCTVSTTLRAMVSMIIATTIYFYFALAIELLAFWLDVVWNLTVMLIFIVSALGGRMLPLSLFPAWAEPILNFLPFSYIVSFPVRTFMGQVTLSEWYLGLLISLFWIYIAYMIAVYTWRRGLLRYTGVGV